MMCAAPGRRAWQPRRRPAWPLVGAGYSVSVPPMRVIAHGDGAEVLLTLFRLPGWTDEQFDRDAALVMADLQTLKRLLESKPHTANPPHAR